MRFANVSCGHEYTTDEDETTYYDEFGHQVIDTDDQEDIDEEQPTE